MTAESPPKNEPETAAPAGAGAASGQRTDGRREASRDAPRAAGTQAQKNGGNRERGTGNGGRYAQRSVTHRNGRNVTPRSEQNAQPAEAEPERIFVIIECRTIDGGWAGDMTAGELGAWMKFLAYSRAYYWNCEGSPLADLTKGWRTRRGIRDADWFGMLRKARKAGNVGEVGGYLKVLNPDWLRSPASRKKDETAAERMRRLRDKKKARKTGNGKGGPTAAEGDGQGAVTRNGAQRTVTPPLFGPHIEKEEDQSHSETEEAETAVRKRKEKAEPEPERPSGFSQGPGSDTAVPDTAPDTAAGATEPPPLSRSDAQAFMAHPTFEAVVKLSLLSLAFGPKYTRPQKQRLQEAVEEARKRGATLGMIYLRMKSRRPAGQNAFDIVREAGTDAHRCLTRFREIAGVESLSWTEIDRLAFDTTIPREMQRQGEWNEARKEFVGVLHDVRGLSPIEATRLMEGGGA